MGCLIILQYAKTTLHNIFTRHTWQIIKIHAAQRKKRKLIPFVAPPIPANSSPMRRAPSRRKQLPGRPCYV